MGLVIRFIKRALVICLAATMGWVLASQLGVVLGAAVWIAATGVACGTAALLLRRQGLEKITWVNHVAGYLLPWGYALGKGQLPAITLISWAGLSLIGIAAMLASVKLPGGLGGGASGLAGDVGDGKPERWMLVVLAISWLVMGGVVAKLGSVMVIQGRTGRVPRSLVGPTVVMSLLIVGSVGLTMWGSWPRAGWMAMALTAGPVVFVAGCYGLLVLVFATVGRNMRWH